MAVWDALGSRPVDEPGEAAEEGFNGELRCASLADLIQLQCGCRIRAAVSVRSHGRDAHLFFEDGQIIHAFVGDRVGEAALFELLSWTAGTFGPSQEQWPEAPTVTSSWQHVLLTAAQRRDEMQPGFPAVSTSRLMAVKQPPPKAAVSVTREAVVRAPRARPKVSQEAVHEVAITVQKAWERLTALPSVLSAARLGSDGEALEVWGDGQRLLGLAESVCRLAELMGESLGQTGFRAFECCSEGTSLVLFADAGSYVVAETTTLSDLEPLYRA